MTDAPKDLLTIRQVYDAMQKALGELRERGFIPFPAADSSERPAAMSVVFRKTTKLGNEEWSSFVINELSTNLDAYADGTKMQTALLQMQAAQRASHGFRVSIRAPEATPNS